MPIKDLLKNHDAFGPADVKVLVTVFEEALKELGWSTAKTPP
jgi:hypothetical protein